MEVHGQRIVESRHQPGFRSRLHRKDLAIALEAGIEVELPLPCTGLVHGLFSVLVGGGEGGAALVRALEAMSRSGASG